VEKQRLTKGLWLALLLCAAAVAAPVYAQGGGKAEPLRIEFKRGANSATVKGRVRNDEQAEYTFAVHQGQHLTLRLASSPAQSSRFVMMGPDGADLKLEHNGYTWSGVAPLTGDYLIYITKPGDRNRSSFSLTLIIK
jgi:hypothetical protein